MSKNRPLTREELGAFQPNEHVLDRLQFYALRCGKPRRRIRVLDWGCGRGRMVVSLRRRGFEAYGVDLDKGALLNGRRLVEALGYPAEALSGIDSYARTRFPAKYFDFVFSNQVLEHVRDLSETVSEISRITTDDGEGLHIFPPRWHMREAHLRMPFVHWLPKNRARRTLIHLWSTIGVESKWRDMDADSLQDRVETYYRYSVEKTFYRPNASIARVFHAHGMQAAFCTVDNPKLDWIGLVQWARRLPYARALMNAGLASLVSAELSTRTVQTPRASEGD